LVFGGGQELIHLRRFAVIHSALRAVD